MTGLLPDEANARARAVEWMFAALNTIEPPIWDRVFAKVIEREESWSKPRLPAVEARVRERLGELSDRLGDADWLDGAFSAGDLMMISVLRIPRGAIVDEYPNLSAYVARSEARPAFTRALDAQLGGFTGKPPCGLQE